MTVSGAEMQAVAVEVAGVQAIIKVATIRGNSGSGSSSSNSRSSSNSVNIWSSSNNTDNSSSGNSSKGLPHCPAM